MCSKIESKLYEIAKDMHCLLKSLLDMVTTTVNIIFVTRFTFNVAIRIVFDSVVRKYCTKVFIFKQ